MSHSNLDDSIARRVRHVATRFGATELTLTGEYSVSPDSGTFHFLNPGGVNRTVRLPLIDTGGGQLFLIMNRGVSGTLNVVDSNGVAVVNVAPTVTVFFMSSPTGWQSATVSSTTDPVTDGDKGDVIVSGGGAIWTIDDDVVTYGKIQNVTATGRVLGRFSAGSGDIEEGTGTQVTALLDVFTSTLKGLAPPSGGGTSAFLRADGSWVTPSGTGSGLSDAFQIITDGATNSVAVGAGSFRLRTTAPLTVATQNNDPTFGDNALFALANGTALSVFGVTGNASAQRADIAGTVGQVLRVSGTTLAFGSIDLSVAATVGTSDLAFANLAQGTARSVLGVTGNATADVASIQGAADQVLRVNGAGTALAFGAIDLSKSAAATGILQAASFPTLTGDVTTAGGALATTIANNAVTYAKMQDVSATARIIGRKTAAAGDPEECTLSDVLDFVGSAAQGDILYRGASTWTRLGAGTSGQVLQTNGTGANPSWVTPSAGGSGGLLAIQVFAASGTYTPTSGMTNCIIECIGGGGGGGGVGGVTADAAAAGGGGSGGYSRKLVTAATVGASKAVTVGAAGAGASNLAGTSGGDTYVGTSLAASLCGALGGSGGARHGSAGTGLGGNGGSPTTAVGDVKSGGAPGGGGYYASGAATSMAAGFGGSGPFGGGALAIASPTSGAAAGANAVGYGSGGGGAGFFGTGSAAGGSGSAGLVIITEFK